MKNLYESIFSGRSNVANQTNNSLWAGWDEAMQDYKIRSDDFRSTMFIWHLDHRNNNIIQLIYHYNTAKFLAISKEFDRGSIILRIENESTPIVFRQIKIRGLKRNDPRIPDYILSIARAFREHPEMLMDNRWKGKGSDQVNYTYMTWNDFKKYFIDE